MNMKAIFYLVAVLIAAILADPPHAAAGAYGTGVRDGYVSYSSAKILSKGTIFRIVCVPHALLFYLADYQPGLYIEKSCFRTL